MYLIKCAFLFAFFLTSFLYAARDICGGDGKYEFGTRQPGTLEDQEAPFIFGSPPAMCTFKKGEKDRIIEEVLAAAKGTKDRAIAVFTMGAPGCGKSSAVARVLEQLGFQKDDLVNIDVDDIRSKMTDFIKYSSIPSKRCPGKLRAYTAIAPWCSKPSAQVRDVVFYKALEEKRSFILDGTCRDAEYCRDMMTKAHEAGFTPHLVAVWAKLETCSERARIRAYDNGRWVESDFVAGIHEGLKEANSFNDLASLAVKFGGEAWIFNTEGESSQPAFHRSSNCSGSNKEACKYYGVTNRE